MKITIRYSFFLAFCLAMFFISCSESDPVSNLQQHSEESLAEMYMSSHETPAIMFSYNIYDNDKKEMLSYLIDDEGNVKTITQEKFSAREGLQKGQTELEELKQNSTLVEGLKIDIDELVNNFNLLRTADQIEFDRDVQKPEPQIHTSTYGYYYFSNNRGASGNTGSSATNECGGGGSSSSTSSSGSYRAPESSFSSILLEQTLDFDLVQQNENAKWLVSWINDIVTKLDVNAKETSN